MKFSFSLLLLIAFSLLSFSDQATAEGFGWCWDGGQIPCSINCDTEECPEGTEEVTFLDPGGSMSCVCYPPAPPLDRGCTGNIQISGGYLEDIKKLESITNSVDIGQIDPTREGGYYRYFEDGDNLFDPETPAEDDIAVPVGTPFYLQYIGRTATAQTPPEGCPEDNGILFTKSELSNQEISSPLDAIDQRIALFKDSVVVSFAATTPSRVKQFYAAHYGKATITIVPDNRYDNYFPPIVIHVMVVPPKDITDKNGVSIPQYGNENIVRNISDIVHRRGISLKLLLAQIKQESEFNPQAYRYEPRIDYQLQENDDPKYVPILKQQELPYSPQNIAANIEGAYDTENMNYPLDVMLRNNSKYPLNTIDIETKITRRLQDDDNPTTAELITANPIQNWTVMPLWPVSGYAQTTSAASYGLIQPLFLTAFDMARKYGLSKEVKPSRLVDTVDNLNAGWGSLNIGTLYLLDRMKLTTTPESYKNLLESYKKALKSYNGSSVYPEKVLSKIKNYNVIPNPDPLDTGYPYISYYIFYRQNGYY